MNNVVISFFKENKISYRINDDRTITYPCFYCKREATITPVRTHFICNGCKKTGTLVHLIKFLKEQDSSIIEEIQYADIYDEKKELKEMTNLLRKLGDDSIALAIKEKVFRILENKKI